MKEKKVIIVEDDTQLCENIAEFLCLKGLNTKGVFSALELYQELAVEDYDLAVVDIGLPDQSGFEVVKHLRDKTDLGIVILTARDGINDKIKGYESGADFYFVKPVDCRELAATVTNLLTRLDNASSGEDADAGTPSVDDEWRIESRDRSLVSPSGISVSLTAKEWSFLEILRNANGEPVSRDDLLEALDYSLNGPYGSRALDVMVVRLRKKIKEITGKDSPIKTVYSYGYSFGVPSTD